MNTKPKQKPLVTDGAKTAANPIKTRYEPEAKTPLWQSALLALGVCHLFLIPMSLFALSESTGPTESFKLILVGVGAAAAAYVVNRFAIEKLAPLHAIGFRMAGAFAAIIILATGSGMFLGSLNALVHAPVEARVYQENGQKLETYIANAHEAVLVAERIAPSVLAVGDDIQRTATCEVRSSCLSRNGNGGRGPMSVALEAVAAQAYALSEALDRGAVERAQRLEDLNRLYREYTEELAKTAIPLADRRVALQSIHAKIRQIAAALNETMPIGLVESFVQGLRAGASVAGAPSGSITLNAYLRDHGNTLNEVLDRMPETDIQAPSFPPKPGMLDILNFLAEFAAISGIVFVAELCLPITFVHHDLAQALLGEHPDRRQSG